MRSVKRWRQRAGVLQQGSAGRRPPTPHTITATTTLSSTSIEHNPHAQAFPTHGSGGFRIMKLTLTPTSACCLGLSLRVHPSCAGRRNPMRPMMSCEKVE
eukprot:CAMPEP_0181214368 /NCGR_PEP_ID=MMETSP1096-20121128/25413_1 /TAXON_ID=156174 ORGANISM="Chrysochromulina ericina, Strain CCMP281" /NCGR_SAMPLE_ID=MMETSP1096 /ASSEMBLY_ACC=CAM_ASM_000453 /LENGTH=99 /DNA_ID=CAMNT_0023306093 /DNA_START=315 /DNA_END=614 /DNA_ORIENTATION=+